MVDCCLNILQGVTLTDLKEAESSSRARQIKDGESLDERFCPRKHVTEDGGVKKTEQMGAGETSPSWRLKGDVSEEDACRIQFCLMAAPKYPKPSLNHL